MTAISTIDLNDIRAFASAEFHPMFDWLRDHDPIHWQPEGDSGFWSITRYDDVAAGYHDHVTFSSAAGIIQGGSFHDDVDTASNRMLVAADPPRHRQLRQIIHRAFTPQFQQRVARQVEILVDRELNRAMADGGCDLATDLAPLLPTGALMAMVQMPEAEARWMVDLTHSMIGYREPIIARREQDERVRLAGIQADIFDYFAELMDDRAATPGDDLVGILQTARIGGRPLRTDEILYNCLNIAVGGNETSTHSTSHGVLAFMDHPDQAELFHSGQASLKTTLHEILRWTTPNAYDHRVATRDVTLQGREIHAGDSVLLWAVSANRDDRQFESPHVFDVRREPNRHLSFGSGIHRCIGAQLGFIELSIFFRKVAERGIAFESAGEVVRFPSNFILGISSLPVTVRTRGGQS